MTTVSPEKSTAAPASPAVGVLAPAIGTVIALSQLLALDDSCQKMLYTEGHVDITAFVEACKADTPYAEIDQAKCRHAWLWWRPATAEEAAPGVSDTVAEIEDKPGKGAVPITICDDWLPLHNPKWSRIW